MKKILLKIYTLTKDDVINIYCKYKLVSLDGKIRPTSMIVKIIIFINTACRRRFEYIKGNEIINAEKIKHKIIEKETELQNLIQKH